MNDQFVRQAEQFLNAARDARIPENMQALAIEGVSKSRETYAKFAAVAADQAKAAEDVMIATQAGAKSIGAKLLDNATKNTSAAFDAAEALARARTVQEALQIQAAFMQSQFAAAGTQAQELLTLSARFAQQGFETANTAAAKAFDQAKKA